LWSCWNERNRSNHGEHHKTIDQFQFSFRQHVQAGVEGPSEKINPSEHALFGRWEKPSPDFVKINMDASFHLATKSGG
jgi:hypothetical protein